MPTILDVFLTLFFYRRNRYTPDVSMATEDLEEALVEIGAAVDEQQIINRKYDDIEHSKSPWDFTTQLTHQSRSYDSFEACLLKGGRRGRIDEEEENEEEEFSFIKNMKKVDFEGTKLDANAQSMRVESPSIIINDMLGDEQGAMAELLDATMRTMDEDAKSNVSRKKSALIADSATDVTNKFLSMRNELIDKTIRQLEQIKNLDETLSSIKCQASPAQLSQLKDMLNTT